MELVVPFRVEYHTEEPVSIPAIIDSLIALQRVLEEAGHNLEEFVHGLTIERVSIRVKEISHGSLKEVLLIGLFAFFQEDLEREIPALIHEFTGVQMPENTHTLLTILALVAIVYGADFIKQIVADKVKDSPIRHWKEALIEDLANRTGRSYADVKKALDDRYSKPSRIKTLGDAAVKFFRPSKQQGDAPILIGDRRIEPPLIADTPDDYVYEDAATAEKSSPHDNVRLQIHQKDIDRENAGWAAIPVGLHPKRLPMKLVDGVTSGHLWDADEVTGDIILISRRRGVDFVPAEIHLTRVD